MGYNDYRDIIRQMEREMQQFSDEAFRNFFGNTALGGAGRFWQPPVDVHETDVSILVKMELAGVKPDDLHVSLSPDDRVLTVSGSRSESRAVRDGRVRCHQLEIYFGPFERAVGLPHGVPLNRDAITASYREGFLLVTLPKRVPSEEKPQTRTIPITDAAGKDHNLESEDN